MTDKTETAPPELVFTGRERQVISDLLKRFGRDATVGELADLAAEDDVAGFTKHWLEENKAAFEEQAKWNENGLSWLAATWGHTPDGIRPDELIEHAVTKLRESKKTDGSDDDDVISQLEWVLKRLGDEGLQ